MKHKVLCLLPTLNDTRIARRIDMLKQAGFDVEAAAFIRGEQFGRLPDCPIERLEQMSHGNYLARIPKILLSVRQVRSAIGRNDIVYAFNPDLALLAMIAAANLQRPIVLEVAGIRSVQVSDGWQGRMVRTVERLVAQRCRLLILTTAGYYPYYQDWLRIDTPGLVIENKVDSALVADGPNAKPPRTDDKPLVDRPLRIGWFGQLRDEWSLNVIECLTSSDDARFTAVIAGRAHVAGGDFPSIENLEERISGNANIEFRGDYSYHEELTALYESVDMVMACYPPQIPHGWSQSNRYYEACLFRRPLIVRDGCSDASEVRQHAIGLVIGESDISEAEAAIRELSALDWMRWFTNMSKLPRRVYSITDEVDALKAALTGMVHV